MCDFKIFLLTFPHITCMNCVIVLIRFVQVDEAHLYAKMDFECRVNGAEMLAYPPVVAGMNSSHSYTQILC